MSSPAPSNDGDAPKNNQEQITFRFCAECSNMLYPKEDEDAHKLQFTCRTCQYTEEATSSCVFRNVINSAAGETAGVTQDVGSDPTDPASVDEYNHFVRHNSDYAVTRTLDSIRFASYWASQDDDGKAAWADEFASCSEPIIPHLSQDKDSLAYYISSNNFLTSLDALDADPPEALENPPEYGEILMPYSELISAQSTQIASR
ncbi:DNA-directed RNA polymerase II subunit RPB9 [Daldinia childiae]|uniref:DNA-directed RNA polymerase II subunit RPB9 n=1 Tax=Daldinia childiae TaxID=326645 RepID=UPI001446FF57|nr:DNA-directed RNA polymerase II subunit RPB9 [Daldinia childiae]KAF3059801.1 DNA-directed RNA polymerase II subunit RPB9 [Daldinia childiae]